MSKRTDRAGRLLALALRHDPGAIGIALDAQGYAGVEEVLQGLAARGLALSRKDLDWVIETNDKRRFAFNADKTRIRASQGHSVTVELGYEPQTPPTVLFHGTATRHLESIQQLGLVRGQRQHVHLSATEDVAMKVGRRHGVAVVLEVDAARMHMDGHRFYLAANGVWLADHVPVTYLQVRS